jgi:hypothetical protein
MVDEMSADPQRHDVVVACDTDGRMDWEWQETVDGKEQHGERMTPSPITVKPQPGERVGEWTLATDDTRLTIGAELVQGLEVTLKGAPVSELVWIEEINQ